MKRSMRTYNRVMADRIVCSCVLCPKCGAWVVLSAHNESGSKHSKIRTSCPVADCGSDFEFDFDEIRKFELPLRLFERRHFYRSDFDGTRS